LQVQTQHSVQVHKLRQANQAQSIVLVVTASLVLYIVRNLCRERKRET
jgi:hypothetical protein